MSNMLSSLVPPISYDTVTVMAGATFFALLWSLSALHKLSNWQSYRDQLRDYQVVPEAVVSLLAPVLLIVEMALAIAWIFDVARQWATLPSAILLASYGAAMAWNLARGRDSIDCGCGGEGQLIRPALVVRNLFLALCSLLPMWFVESEPRALSWPDFITIAGAGLVMYGAYVVTNQLLANNPPQRSAH